MDVDLKLPGLMWNGSLYLRGSEKVKKEIDHFWLINGSFNKKENLFMRLVLDAARRVDFYTQPQEF